MREDDLVLLARIVRPQGRRGEVLAEIFTDFPEQFATRKSLFLRPPAGSGSQGIHETKVESQWLHQGRIVLKLALIESITDAEKLRGFELVIPREERLPLKDDAVYVSDLMGSKVFDVSSGVAVETGEIIDVEPEATGPAMLIVRTAAKEEVLIPFVRAYLKKVDIDAKRLEMDLPAGLGTLQAPATEEERRALDVNKDGPES